MISVCLCTHEPRPEILQQALEALLAQDAQATPWELLVVDHGSSKPPKPGGLLGAAFPVPTRLVREERPGLAGARARALRETQGEILLLLDEADFLEPASIAAVARFFQSHPKAGAVGGRAKGVSDRPLPAWFDSVAAQLGVRDHGDREIPLSGDVPCTAGMAVRRRALEKAVSWPSLLAGRPAGPGSWIGDTELCLRMARSGWELWHDPSLRLERHVDIARLQADAVERLQEDFGMARPYLELYVAPEVPWRRLKSLRRSLMVARQSRTLGRQADRATDESSRLELRLRCALSRGLSRGLWALATGPAVWREVARRIPRRPAGR